MAPQLDLETLVSACAGGSCDRKIACEPLADGDEPEPHHTDSPPASFWLSGDAEYDWWDRNAVVYERNESTKGNSIVSSSTNPGSNSNSQRFSKNLKHPKAAIIGLPKSQKASFNDVRSRRSHHRPCNARLFPKRSASVRSKSDTVVIEPLSPKVSCIGRVRSKRDRNRRLRTRQRSISSTTTVATTVVRQKSNRSQKKKSGFFASVCAIFRSGSRGKSVQKPDPNSGDSLTKKKRSNSRKTRGGSMASRTDTSFEESVRTEPAGLGSMNRFASGRRSESWGVGEPEIQLSH